MPPDGWSPAPDTPQQQEKTAYYPDVYSKIFVPKYLRDINHMPATPVRAMPPPNVDYNAFISAFCGSSYLAPFPRLPILFSTPDVLPDGQTVSPTPTSPTAQGSGESSPVAEVKEQKVLALNTYTQHFVELIRNEMIALTEEARSYSMYRVPLTVHDPKAPHLFRLSVPGLRENAPMLQLGDVVRLRQLVLPDYYHGYPGFTGYEYETFVFGMDKAKGYIVLRADGLYLDRPGWFNVIFCSQTRLWEGSHRAILDIGVQLDPKNESSPANKSGALHGPSASAPITVPPRANAFLRRMLFPEKEDGVMQYNATTSVYRRKWFDRELNFEQVSPFARSKVRVLLHERK